MSRGGGGGGRRKGARKGWKLLPFPGPRVHRQFPWMLECVRVCTCTYAIAPYFSLGQFCFDVFAHA